MNHAVSVCRQWCRRHRRSLRTAVFLLAAGLAYFAFTQITGWYLPCPVRALTGWLCPGCGISHFCSDLLRLDVASAVQQNLAVAVLLPVWLAAGVWYVLCRPAALRQGGWAYRALVWGSLIAVLAFGLFRNLPGFAFLRPLYLRG